MPNLTKKKQIAFESLVRPHLDTLYRLAYRLTGNQVDSEDLVQETIAKIYPKQEDLAKLDRPGSWLAKVLYNLFVDQRRRNQRSPVVNVGDLGDDGAQVISLDIFPAHNTSLENNVDRGQFMQRVNEALEQLSDDQRIALMMYEVEGYSLTEIENITDVPVGTLKSRLHRARNQLKALLFAQGTEFDAESCKGAGDY